MNNRDKFAMSQATVIVLDKSTPRDMIRSVERLGRGWKNGVNHWRTFGHEFALLIGKREGESLRGPRVVLTDIPEVGAAVVNDEVAGLLCAWMYCCSDANTDRIQRAVLECCGTAGTA